MGLHIKDLVQPALQKGAIWIHLSARTVPIFQTRSQMERWDSPPLEPQQVYEVMESFINPRDKERLFSNREVLVSHTIDENISLRIHVFMQRSTLAMSIKIIETGIKSLKDLEFPQDMWEVLSKKPSGLFIVAGSRDSGKTAIVKAILDELARTRSLHILSLEEAFEGELGPYSETLISRRLFSQDVADLRTSLQGVLKEDLNAVSLGELHGLDKLESAITLASRGLFVLGTMLASDVENTLMKMLHCFNAPQELVELLAQNLLGVYHQTPVQNSEGARVYAREYFRNYPVTRKHLRLRHVPSILSFMQTAGKIDCLTYARNFEVLVRQEKLTSRQVPEKYRR
jgi:twitching motility protein PilT